MIAYYLPPRMKKKNRKCNHIQYMGFIHIGYYYYSFSFNRKIVVAAFTSFLKYIFLKKIRVFIIRSQKQTKLNSEKRVYVDANNNSKNKNKENCLLA